MLRFVVPTQARPRAKAALLTAPEDAPLLADSLRALPTVPPDSWLASIRHPDSQGFGGPPFTPTLATPLASRLTPCKRADDILNLSIIVRIEFSL